MQAFALILLTIALANCGGDGGSAPTTPDGGGGSTVSVLVVLTPVGGTYTATLNNQTYTAAGGFSVSLRPGTHEIAGSFRGDGFGVGFASIGGGGAESGSLRSLSGPSPQVTACTAIYFNTGTTATLREFRLQFRVTTNVGSACQGG